MRRHLRWIFGAAALIGALAYALLHGMETTGESLAVIVGVVLGPVVAFGPEVYGEIEARWNGKSVSFGDDGECEHDEGAK